MNRFRLAAAATLIGVLLASGCASPCGCGGFHRMSMFRARAACPCECCSNCGGGSTLAGAGSMMGEGPLLEPPGASMGSVPPPMGMDMPGPLPSTLGAPAVPSDPGRINPMPLFNAAQPVPSQPSSRVRR